MLSTLGYGRPECDVAKKARREICNLPQHRAKIYMRALRQDVILNSEEVAIALLEKRSHKYSDRPVFPAADLYVPHCLVPFRSFFVLTVWTYTKVWLGMAYS
jgi:hypothetical protein